MNKVSERYNTRVEIPISVILETIFSDDNKDVETLCRWAKKYGFVDLEDKYYKLQEDYTKQSFYIWLNKKERKQYDYEDYLLNKNEQLQQERDKYKFIVDKVTKQCEHYLSYSTNDGFMESIMRELLLTLKFDESKADEILNKIKELEEGNNN